MTGIGLGLLGAGGQAAEVVDYVGSENVRFFAVDAAYLRDSQPPLCDVDTDDPALTELPVVAAVGAPGLRRELVARWSGSSYRTVQHPTAYVAATAAIGEGCVIAPLSAVSSRTSLGRHVIVNLSATVSHDCTVGDFVTISPGAHIAGGVTIQDGAFVGIGASVSNGVTIAAGSVIGAGAVVIRDTEPNGVYAGAPARRLGTREDWLREL
ncbi:acetyltransferase [Leifsonia sp. LS-T14]|uniref:acetyltransferase n=1 Tax=unclassified Leifsonia TaxID=2663824 RepID=UPI0035A5DA8C